ncbi:unnamed protein product [Parajaminaea phylloscopi]
MVDAINATQPHGLQRGTSNGHVATESVSSEVNGSRQQPSHPLRRQSDSTLTWRERLPNQVRSDDARAKLRQWAAEALDAPPPLLAPCEPTQPDEALPKTASLGRRNRTRSRSPPPSSRVEADTLFSRRSSLFVAPEGALSSSPRHMTEASQHSLPAHTAFQSMSASVGPANAARIPRALTSSVVQASPTSGDAHKGLAQRRLESGQLTQEHLLSVSGLAARSKGPEIAPHTLSLGQQGDGTPGMDLMSGVLSDETTPRPHLKSPPRSILPRLSTGGVATLGNSKTVRLEEPSTPRASAGISTESPRSTASTCASDDDGAVLTPLDGGSMLCPRRQGSADGLQRQSTLRPALASPPTISNDPVGQLSLDLNFAKLSDDIAGSPIATFINGSCRQSTASLQQTERRQSLSGASQSQSSSDHKADSQQLSSSKGADASEPLLSHSTLRDLGSIKGLTPPCLPTANHSGPTATATASAESSSVVSAGLEMGLGMNMATAALAAQLPVRTAGLSSFAEPRHHGRRPSLASDPTAGSARGTVHSPDVFRINERDTSERDAVDAAARRPSSRSDHALEEPPLDGLSLTDTDLSRRKTTGWDAKKARRDVSKRGRSEAPDETMSHLAMRNSSSMYQQHLLRDGPPVISLLPLSTDLSEISRGGASSTRSSFDSRDTLARASRTGSTHVDTPSLSGRAMLSPDVNPLVDLRGGILVGDDGPHEDEHVKRAKAALLRDAANGGQASFGNNGGLMGSNVGGHFGPGVRAKVINVLEPLIAGVPMTGEEGEVIHLAEYGCLNSRSIPLMQLIISKFARRSVHKYRNDGHAGHSARELDTVSEDAILDSAYGGSSGVEGTHGVGGSSSSSRQRPSLHAESQSSRVFFTVLHEDASNSDFRPIAQSLDARSDSYLDSQWQANHCPSLQNHVFSSFVGRPFASRIAPPQTMHFGLSLMDLHWIHTPANNAVPLATCSHAELSTFLKARALEFKKGGVLMIAFLARSDDASLVKRSKSASQASAMSPPQHERSGSSSGAGQAGVSVDGSTPSSYRKTTADIWTKLTNTLAPCIQRLVSCGMLKSDVARFLLDLPLHPRTPRQTQSALGALRHLWRAEWSCGLGQEGASGGDADPTRLPLPPSEPQPLRIGHPAWKAFQAGTLSRVAFTEHMLMLFKNLYESHFRTVLRERGKLSKGAVEFVLDSLWDILSSKIDDQHPNNPFEEVEIEVSMCALRRV